MKTIQIPMNSNPFTVVINNSVYQYKAGELIEVPDEVAEAIEDSLKLEPKPKRYLNKLARLANGTLPEITASDLDGIETFAYYAFGQCYSLTSVEIPKSVKKIEKSTFASCLNLKTVILGDGGNLAIIDEDAFNYCKSLVNVYLPNTPPALTNVNAFAGIASDCKFYCKSQASLDAYKVAENWSTLASTYSFVVES